MQLCFWVAGDFKYLVPDPPFSLITPEPELPLTPLLSGRFSLTLTVDVQTEPAGKGSAKAPARSNEDNKQGTKRDASGSPHQNTATAPFEPRVSGTEWEDPNVPGKIT